MAMACTSTCSRPARAVGYNGLSSADAAANSGSAASRSSRSRRPAPRPSPIVGSPAPEAIHWPRSAASRACPSSPPPPRRSWRRCGPAGATPSTARTGCRAWNASPSPRLGKLPVSEVTSADMVEALRAVWQERPATERRVRQRISTVMEWAVALKYRDDNPCSRIGPVLGPQQDLVQHMRALPHRHVAAVVETVRSSGAAPVVKLAFEFLVLTAARSGEVRGAESAEIDPADHVWTVPATRTKAKREHRVPLTRRAEQVLDAARTLSNGNALVFPSPRGKRFNDMALSGLLRTLEVPAVPHGFRSTFRDRAAEETNPREVVEAALAHVVQNKVEAAYARSDLFERRRRLMDDWSAYVVGAGDTRAAAPTVTAGNPIDDRPSSEPVGGSDRARLVPARRGVAGAGLPAQRRVLPVPVPRLHRPDQPGPGLPLHAPVPQVRRRAAVERLPAPSLPDRVADASPARRAEGRATAAAVARLPAQTVLGRSAWSRSGPRHVLLRHTRRAASLPLKLSLRDGGRHATFALRLFPASADADRPAWTDGSRDVDLRHGHGGSDP